jgi:putative salt-induced outer membrane protein
MQYTRHVAIVLCLCGCGTSAAAQAPPEEPPPLWDSQVGASFVGTSGNSDTATVGADFSMHRRWPVWQIEATATAVRTASRGDVTAERYLGAFRGQRKLTSILGLTAGERGERDRFAGIDFRSVLDAGLTYALVRDARWTLDGLTSVAWSHERPVSGPGRDDPVGVLQALSKLRLSPTSDTTQRFTFYPDFSHSAAYRTEAELAAQAAMTNRLALKIGYLWRFSNEPVPTFLKNDHTVTASVVLRWKAAAPAK